MIRIRDAIDAAIEIRTGVTAVLSSAGTVYLLTIATSNARVTLSV